MANKREYTIVINGLKESYEGVKSLREALEGIDERLVQVEQTTEKTSQAQKTQTSSIDALAKAQDKLNNYDKEYQTELTKVNAQLSANKKEINEAIKLQQAQDIVDAKQLDTYKDKQTYLSALNTLIRNHTTATDADVQAIDKMVQESAALQAELKATDETMKIYVRNVGNYNEAADKVVESHKSVKSELKDLKNQMADMLANGVSKTDEAYLQLAERAGYLKDSIKDANEDITNFASDTRGMTNAINIASSAVNMWQLYNSAMAAFGVENEEAGESMKKMMAIMTLLNSLQQVQNSLLENGSATARLYSKAVDMISSYLGIKKTATEENIAATEASTLVEEANAAAQEANATAQETSAAAAEANTVSTTLNTTAEEANTVATGTNSGAVGTNSTALQANAAASNTATTATNTLSVAQKAGAVASNILSVALRAIPLMAVIGLVMALIQNWESIWNWFKKTFPVLDKLSNKIKNFGGFLNSLITAVKATAYAIRDYLISAITSLGTALSKLFSGDFSGAADALKNIFKDAGKSASNAFNSELSKGFIRGEQERTAAAAEESNKRTKQELEELKIRERNNKTYSKKYIELQQKEFDERKAMAKGNQEELNKIKLEEMQFYADVEDKKTAYAKEQGQKRANDAKKAAKAAADAQKQAEKEAEEERKAIEEQKKKNQKTIADSQKADTEKWKSDIIAADAEAKKKLTETAKDFIELYSDSLIQRAKLTKLYTEKEGLEAKKLQKQQELSIKKSEALAKTASGNIEDVSGKARAAIEGIESEILDIESSIVEVDGKIGETQANLYSDTVIYEKRLRKIDELTARRMTNMIQLLAQKAKEQKQTIVDEIADIESRLLETNSKLAKSDDKELKEQKAKLETQLKNAKQRLSDLFGEYADKEIKVPVNIDIDQIIENYNTLRLKMKENNQEMSFSLSSLTQFVIGADEAFSGMVGNAFFKSDEPKERVKNLNSLFEQLVQVLGLSEEKTVELWEKLQQIGETGILSDEAIKELKAFFDNGEVRIGKLGSIAKDARQDLETLVKYTAEEQKKAYDKLISEQDKIISNNEKIVKNFREATREFKPEPVMEQYEGTFKKIDRHLGLMKLNMEKTKERYATLKASYKSYLEAISEGSEQMIRVEEAWQNKLEATKAQYGEDSIQYKLMLQEKESAMKAYAAEREKVQQQLDDLENQEEDLPKKWLDNNLENIEKIIKTFQDNVMNPIFDAMGDYFALQVEEAQQALDDITELLDKATEAREESAERVKQINDEIKDSDASNRANLEQQLADEQVLLVQREETERALEKEKKKRQYEVDMAEYNQRKFELGQKLIEGLVNTALGVTAALKYGPILGPIFAAIIGAMGAVQTAIIGKQIQNLKKPQKYATGGKVGEQGISRSHSQGGHRIEGTDIEVEGQEWVINKKSSDKYDDLLKAINEDNTILIRKEIENIHERRVYNKTPKSPVSRYANGGRLDTVNTVQSVQATSDVAAISELIRQINFEPVVSVVDINKKQRNLTKVVDLAGKR